MRGNSICIGKVNVSCQICNNQIQVMRPDNAHPFCSLEKTGKDEDLEKISIQELECKNPSCQLKFTICCYDK